MSIISKRELIKQAYPHSKTWPTKVKNMSEPQVVAVYLRLRKKGKI